MHVIFSGIALIMAFVLSAPLHIVFHVRIADRIYAGVGAALFSAEAAVRRAGKRAQIRGARRRKPKTKGRAFRLQSLPHAARLTLALLPHMRVERVSATGTVSTNSAARTALLCGYARAAQTALAAVLPDRTDLRVTPDFSSSQSDIRILGMIRVSVGHIIFVGISNIKELTALWKSTRLNP